MRLSTAIAHWLELWGYWVKSMQKSLPSMLETSKRGEMGGEKEKTADDWLGKWGAKASRGWGLR